MTIDLRIFTEIRIKKASPIHRTHKGWKRYLGFSKDHYKFADGSSSKNYWVGPLWIQVVRDYRQYIVGYEI